MAVASRKKAFYGTGRRKTSTARVYLRTGTGRTTINGRKIEDFFGRETGRMIVRQAFDAVQDIFLHAGRITKKYNYEDVIAPPPTA